MSYLRITFAGLAALAMAAGWDEGDLGRAGGVWSWVLSTPNTAQRAGDRLLGPAVFPRMGLVVFCPGERVGPDATRIGDTVRS